jgi:hypothetical protein
LTIRARKSADRLGHAAITRAKSGETVSR